MTAVIVVPNRTKLRVLRSNAPFGVFFHSGSPGSVQFSCRGAFTPDNPPETPTPKLAVPTVVPNRNGTASSAVQCTLWSNLPRWLTRVSAVLAWRCVHSGRFTQDVCTKVGSSCRRSQSNRTASSAAQCTLRSDLPRWLTRVRAVLVWRCFHPGQFTQGAKKKEKNALSPSLVCPRDNESSSCLRFGDGGDLAVRLCTGSRLPRPATSREGGAIESALQCH